MRILRRYLAWQIVTSVALVLTALLMLFSFFDLINELQDIGQGARTIFAQIASCDSCFELRAI